MPHVMDALFPYAEGAARRHLLYRLPTAPAPRRLLLAYADRADKAIASEWEGPVEVIDGSKLKGYGRHHAAGFDAIALPGLLDSAPAPPADLLRAAHHLLVPGGIVVGHVEHLLAWRRIATPRGVLRWALSVGGRNGVGTAARCLRELARAGFTSCECYFVSPHIDAPMSLVPGHDGSARAQFLRALRIAPHHHGHLSYRLRWVWTALGLGGMQRPHLFFWANKPC